MQALITLPPQLSTIPVTFRKINKTVYYEERTQCFYKVNVGEPLTMFIGENLVTRQNLILTKYDPSYLALQILSQQNTLTANQIPSYLSPKIFQNFTQDQGEKLQANNEKILAFLQQRIDRLNDLVEAKQYIKVQKKLDFVNKDKNGENRKQIKQDVLDVLRKDVPEKYLEELLRTRYCQQQKVMRPVVTDNYFEQVQKEDNREKLKNKKKPPTKSVQPLPRNQPTLFQFSGKKQSKNNTQ